MFWIIYYIKKVFETRKEVLNDTTIYLSIHPSIFDLILYVPSAIFQLFRNGSSWVEPVLS